MAVLCGEKQYNQEDAKMTEGVTAVPEPVDNARKMGVN